MEYCFLGCFAVQHSYEKSSDTSDCHTYSRALDNVIGNCLLNSGRSWHIPYFQSAIYFKFADTAFRRQCHNYTPCYFNSAADPDTKKTI